MGFELDLAAIRSAAGKRKTDPWLMANPANVANLANENQPNSPKSPEALAKLAGLATLAISHRAATPPKPPQSVASVATVASVASSHEPKTASLPPANDPQGFDPGESALMLLAMRFCDAINASDKAREDWRRDVLETPPHLRQGLYNYLREQLRQPHLLWRNQK